jgi:hypothetical protein
MAAPFETFVLENGFQDTRFEFRVFSNDQKVLVIRRSYIRHTSGYSGWEMNDEGALPMEKARSLYRNLRKQSYRLI